MRNPSRIKDERALHEDGQRYQHHDHQELLDAGQDRGAEHDGNHANGKGDVDGQRLQDAAEADPPHVDRTEQPAPQVGPASHNDASLRLGMFEAVFAQGHCLISYTEKGGLDDAAR